MQLFLPLSLLCVVVAGARDQGHQQQEGQVNSYYYQPQNGLVATQIAREMETICSEYTLPRDTFTCNRSVTYFMCKKFPTKCPAFIMECCEIEG